MSRRRQDGCHHRVQRCPMWARGPPRVLEGSSTGSSGKCLISIWCNFLFTDKLLSELRQASLQSESSSCPFNKSHCVLSKRRWRSIRICPIHRGVRQFTKLRNIQLHHNHVVTAEQANTGWCVFHEHARPCRLQPNVKLVFGRLFLIHFLYHFAD